MFSAEDVIALYRHLSAHRIPIWVIGGWGIDALLGKQTRPHKDVDVLMRVDDVARTRTLLQRDSYCLKELWSENRWAVDAQGRKVATAFVLRDAAGREFDAHAMRLDDQGQGIPAWAVPEGFVYLKRELAATGTIGGVEVQCITPEAQMRCHADYKLPAKHRRDVELLHAAFNVPYPDGFSSSREHL